MCDRLAIKAIIRRKHQIDLQMSNVIGDNLKCQLVLAKAFTTIRNRAGELGRQSQTSHHWARMNALTLAAS